VRISLTIKFEKELELKYTKEKKNLTEENNAATTDDLFTELTDEDANVDEVATAPLAIEEMLSSRNGDFGELVNGDEGETPPIVRYNRRS